MRVDNDSHIYDHNFLNHTTMTMKDKLASYNHLIETFVIVHRDLSLRSAIPAFQQAVQ